MRRTTGLLALLALVTAGLAPAPALAGHAGGAWAPGQLLSSPETASTMPRVLAHEGGRATAVWRESIPDRLVWSSRDTSGQWSIPAPVPGSSGVRQISLTSGAAGGEVLTWSAAETTGQLVRSVTRPPGGAWSDPVDLSHLWGSVRGMQAVAGPGGEVVVVWAAGADPTTTAVQSVVRAPDGSWSVPVTVSAAGATAGRPMVAIDGAGLATLAFECDSCGTIQAATRPALGAWSVSVTLSGSAVDPFDPFVATGAGGDAVVSWSAPVPAGPDTRYVVEVARRRDGSWAPPLRVSDAALLDGAFVAASGDAVHVVWSQLVDGLPHVLVRTAVGDTWQAARSVAASATLGNSYALATSTGDLLVAWQEGGASPRPLMSRTLAGGAWTPATRIAHDVRTLGWTTAPDGEALLVWEEQSTATPRGLVQVRSFDATDPVIGSLEVPAQVTAGTTVRLSATATDRWSGVSRVEWRFADGSVRTGSAVEHVFTGQGTQPVSVTVVDGVGHAVRRSVSVAVTAPPAASPRITRLDLTRHRIEIESPRRTARTTRVVVRLSADARVTFSLVRVGSRRPAVTFAVQLAAGRSRLRLTAKVKGRTLRPGTYRLVARARNAAGVSDARRVRLVVRR